MSETTRDKARRRYKEDGAFRRRLLERERARRPLERAEQAGERYERLVGAKAQAAAAEVDAVREAIERDDEGSILVPCPRCKGKGPVSCKRCEGAGKVKKKGPPRGLPRCPRWGNIPGLGRCLVYTAGEFALRVGRATPTIRMWLEQHVLPGATIAFGGKSYFSSGFMAAVQRAQQRVYHLHGLGARAVLGRLIREELEAGGETWVPHGGTEADRVISKRRAV
jgi:hypothetical protein